MTRNAAGSAAAGVAWARRQLGATSARIARWNAQAPGEWCGVWMAALFRAMGLTPPTGYQAAHSWSGIGTEVKSLSEAQPGDVLVWGHQHVGYYIGNGEMISGNWSGTVAAEKVPSSIKGTSLTAIRRPAYKSSSSGGESTLEEIGKGAAGLGFGVSPAGLAIDAAGPVGNLVSSGADAVKNAPGDVAGAVISGLENLLGEKAVPILLNIGLVGGGAFLAYFGIARMVGVDRPVQGPLAAARGAAIAGAA